MTKKSVMEQVRSFPDDLRKALRWKPDPIECDSVILCGMGGSAISGAIAADLLMESSRIPLVTVRDFSIPAWAGERTLAIVSSYSGNTLESLMMYDAARKSECQMIAITSGGKLKANSVEDGVPVRSLPEEMQPRHSIGFMIGYTMSILEACGCRCPDMDRVLDSLSAYREHLESEEGARMVDEMAESIMGTVPAITCYSSLQSVAFRWKSQLNENSKMVAFRDISSDLNDKAIESVSAADRNTIRVLGVGNAGGRLLSFDTGPADVVDSTFRSIMLGDYISIRIAEKRGIDPESVAPIKSLKEKLSRMRSRLGTTNDPISDPLRRSLSRRKPWPGTSRSAP